MDDSSGLELLINGLICALVLAGFIGAGIGIAALVRTASGQQRPHQVLLPYPPDATWQNQPDTTWQKNRPKPGDIWWAHIVFRDGTGAKTRPCLVIRTHRFHVEVLKITSQDKSHRHDHIEVYNTPSWDPKKTRNSYLDLSAPIRLTDDAMRRCAGRCDPMTWAVVQRRHRTGWARGPFVRGRTDIAGSILRRAWPPHRR